MLALTDEIVMDEVVAVEALKSANVFSIKVSNMNCIRYKAPSALVELL